MVEFLGFLLKTESIKDIVKAGRNQSEKDLKDPLFKCRILKSNYPQSTRTRFAVQDAIEKKNN